MGEKRLYAAPKCVGRMPTQWPAGRRRYFEQIGRSIARLLLCPYFLSLCGPLLECPFRIPHDETLVRHPVRVNSNSVPLFSSVATKFHNEGL